MGNEQKQRPMRGVFERPADSGMWWINYYDADGKRHREKVGRRSVAEQAYIQRRAEVREGKFAPPRVKGLSFSDLADAALADKKLYRRPGTWRKDEERLPEILRHFGASQASAITGPRIEAFLRSLRERKLAASTANRYRALLSSIFAFGIREGICARNPVARVRKFREAEGRIRFLSGDEELSLRKALRTRGPACEAEFELALHTGIRRGEQFGLRWANVDLDSGVLTVRGKTGRRFVRLNAIARGALRTLWELSNGSEFVCPGARGADHPDWRKWFEASVEEARIDDFRWHDLRHTFASRLIARGVDLATVSKLLGHRSIQTTMRYAHLAVGQEQHAVDRLAAGTQLELVPSQTGGKSF